MPTPNVVLGGGGNDDQAAHVYHYFRSVLPGNTILFVPHASSPRLRTFAQAGEWIAHSPPFRDCRIDMWEQLAGRSYAELDRFDGICLYGGNTYDLLGALRETGFAELVVEFVAAGRPVLGISAGAFVLGQDITTEAVGSDPDKNICGITDLRGLDVLGGYNVHCHYQSSEDDDLSEYVTRHRVPVLAIPETAGVSVTGRSAHILGSDSVHIFTYGRHEMYAPNDNTKLGA